MYYYEVAPLKIIRADSSVLTYASSNALRVGQLVTVPVGARTITGIVIKPTSKPSYQTKLIASSLKIKPLPEINIKTALWISEFYATHLAVVLQTILPRGITRNRRQNTKAPSVAKRKRTNFVFNKEQSRAIQTLENMSPGTAILHGVTGSGKTAVYIELTKRAVSRGNSVIVLVPEISLTSQLVAEFTHHFKNITLTHSRQTESERHRAWLKALNSNEPQVIIGPRSALFMPALNIGLVIIDEAHEPSYKQDQSPKYSALRVASYMMSLVNGRVVQGSATPLVSEYYLATKSQRPIVEMTQKAKANATSPSVSLVDMTKKAGFVEHRLFSDKLLQAMRQTLESGNQALIFHNRRGSASTTLCQNCGWQALCPRCFVPYTLHTDTFVLRCHICNNHTKVPTFCPECQSTDIIFKGIGTKLIESELKKLFPNKKIMRFDGDSSNNETVDSKYGELYSGDIDIIVGTQVIAKGLDLPLLRTIGVIQADAGLSLPDFASSERTFQLLAQVVGRVGRSEHPSNIVIQSYQPHAPAVQLGITQDYREFYAATLTERKRSNFPPFTYLLKLTCAYKTEAAAVRNAQKLATALRQQHQNLAILGPTPAFYERQHGIYRWQITVKSTKRALLVSIVNGLPPHWQYDIDPISLL